jgi:2-iminobutanoate/2-iminopropanoate deaminase
MKKQIIQTPLAPAPIGPYSQAIFCGDFLFVSGQIAIDPKTDALITDTIIAETHQVMQNIKAILFAAGLDFPNIVKTSIFLSDMNYFAQVNEIYGSYFLSDYPARETVQVSKLPKGVNVEISVTAHR